MGCDYSPILYLQLCLANEVSNYILLLYVDIMVYSWPKFIVGLADTFDQKKPLLKEDIKQTGRPYKWKKTQDAMFTQRHVTYDQ